MRSSCCEAGLLLMLLVGQASAGPQESVESIMARVAENQDRVQQLQSAFVYKRKMAIALRNSGFQRVQADTRMTYESPSEPAPPPFP